LLYFHFDYSLFGLKSISYIVKVSYTYRCQIRIWHRYLDNFGVSGLSNSEMSLCSHQFSKQLFDDLNTFPCAHWYGVTSDWEFEIILGLSQLSCIRWSLMWFVVNYYSVEEFERAWRTLEISQSSTLPCLLKSFGKFYESRLAGSVYRYV
jgi:hypothetical protein